MTFTTSLMPKTRQITRLRLVIWQDFLAFVMWKKPYLHFLLTVFSHYRPWVSITIQRNWEVVDTTIQEFSITSKIIFWWFKTRTVDRRTVESYGKIEKSLCSIFPQKLFFNFLITRNVKIEGNDFQIFP